MLPPGFFAWTKNLVIGDPPEPQEIAIKIRV